VVVEGAAAAAVAVAAAAVVVVVEGAEVAVAEDATTNWAGVRVAHWRVGRTAADAVVGRAAARIVVVVAGRRPAAVVVVVVVVVAAGRATRVAAGTEDAAAITGGCCRSSEVRASTTMASAVVVSVKRRDGSSRLVRGEVMVVSCLTYANSVSHPRSTDGSFSLGRIDEWKKRLRKKGKRAVQQWLFLSRMIRHTTVFDRQ
jgi:hypothetical protein